MCNAHSGSVYSARVQAVHAACECHTESHHTGQGAVQTRPCSFSFSSSRGKSLSQIHAVLAIYGYDTFYYIMCSALFLFQPACSCSIASLHEQGIARTVLTCKSLCDPAVWMCVCLHVCGESAQIHTCKCHVERLQLWHILALCRQHVLCLLFEHIAVSGLALQLAYLDRALHCKEQHFLLFVSAALIYKLYASETG